MSVTGQDAQPFERVPTALALHHARTDFGPFVGTATETATGLTAELTDRDGQVVATMEWFRADDHVVLDSGDVSHLEGPAEGKSLTLKGSTYAVYYYYLQVEAALQAKLDAERGVPEKALALNKPGCDFFPDKWETPCIKACCAAHDLCYELFGCTILSWIGIGNPACQLCNIAVVTCIAACVLVEIIEDLPIWQTESATVR